MPIIQKYSYINSDIEFSEIIEPTMYTGQVIKNSRYTKDANNISYTLPVINAIDIDWNNAYLESAGKHINHTGEILHEVDTVIGKVSYIENLIETGQIPGGDGEIHVDTAAGIPIYTKDYIEELGDNLPESYISIPSPSEMDDKIIDPIQYEDTGNGYYLDILFSTIRQLQAEVVKLRNAFKYGIYSYNDKETAMSNVLSDNEGIDVTEPLWAVDESELSEVTQFDCQLNTAHTLEPKSPVEVGTDLLKITGTASWTDTINELQEVEDNKIFVYLTTTGKHIKFILKNLDIDNDYLTIDLDDLNISSTTLNKYNIMFVINRAMRDPDNEEDTSLYGDNFVWLAVSPYGTGIPSAEGFWLNDRLYDTEKYLGSKENTRYVLYSIEFTDCTIYKFNVYSRYQNFTHNVESFVSDDTDYRYRAAHITIRSVETYTVLTEIKEQLPDNELIFVEATNNLYIKSNNKLIKIGAGGSDDTPDDTDTGMTEQEMLEKLIDLGIVYNNDNDELQLNNVEYIRFIHNNSGKEFEYRTTAYGELKGEEIRTDTIKNRLANIDETSIADDFGFYRGFAAQLAMAEYGLTHTRISNTGDWALNSDRIKISAIYAPVKTDVVHGCTHGYIELANSSDIDFNLEGCYLHFARTNDEDDSITYYHLELKGYIPAGGTYLIRCKKYADISEKNTFINVDSYDIEWYENGELLDLSMVDETSLTNKTKMYEFCLTYGLPNLTQANNMYQDNNDSATKGKATYVYAKYFIDATSINKFGTWSHAAHIQTKNSLYKDTFELDPAKQAFNALSTHDSSRQRWANIATDYQIVSLDKEYIEFPKSEEKYPVANYTPKASYQHKNVCTDKTKLDTEKPNMVTCSFGKNAYTTRCFNWISVGMFDEYVWIYDDDDNLIGRFESYKHIDEEVTQKESFPRRREWPVDVNNIVYSSAEKPRFVGRFPADNTFYTSHKCVVDIVENSVNTPTIYKYIVGQADKAGNPDPEHITAGYTFTLYPESYTPWVYQTTDQQGFHWIEYQVWAGAANRLNELIESDCQENNIMPVLINTGDMTQSGARINEWLDYYNAGINLFKHLEQMNCVGNNDLCGTNPDILGTGDDTGKSNSFFFHIFYCYEVCPITREDNNETVYPIANGKYIPSLYYVDFGNKRFVMVNSEITYINCRDWFNLRYNDNGTIYPVNIYTGYTVTNNASVLEKYAADEIGLTPIYTFMYHYTDNTNGRQIIVGCHEMPYTVITNSSLADSAGKRAEYRSCSGTSLVGSHMNQILANETGAGIYWFSRLLEYRGIKLCVGGHKHTYMLTYPVQERYTWIDENSVEHDSLTEVYPMTENLKSEETNDINNRVIRWLVDGTNYTKLPYTFRDNAGVGESGTFYPYTYVDTEQTHDNHSVIYLMCQATGYKLTSNKELPSAAQKFSQLIPKTSINATTGADSPDKNQRVPMFAVLKLDDNKITCEIARVQNIFSGTTFTQLTYDKGDTMHTEYITLSSENDYGKWNTDEQDTEKVLIEINW